MDYSQLTLQEAMRLYGIENWTLTPSQEDFLIKTTKNLLKKRSLEWFTENQGRLQAELEILFEEI
jgi:hypothetical protein